MNQGRRRLIIILLTVLPVVIFLIGAAVYLITQVRGALSDVDVVVVEELRRQTGRAVEIGRVKISPLGSATIHDLRIANGESFERGTLLEADRVIIRYRFSDLIRRKVAPIQSIDSVRIISPTIVLERYRTGRLNVTDLLKPKPGPRRPPFKGVIDVTNGTLTFRDWQSRLPTPKPTVTRFADLDGTFDASNVPTFVYDFTARSPGRRQFNRVTFTGSLNGREGRLSFDITADNADLAHWSGYFINTGAVKLRQGRGDVKLSATRRVRNGRRTWSYAGSTTVRNGRVSIAGLERPATNVSGRVELVNQLVNVKLSAVLGRTPFTAAGSVAGLTNPKIDIRIASKRADFPQLLQSAKLPPSLKGVRLSGTGPLDVRVVGPTDDLAYIVRTSIPAVSAFGYSARALTIRATLANDVVEVEQASAQALNGRVNIEGAIMLRDGTTGLALSGSALNIQLGLIPQLKSAGVIGRASGRFEVTGTAASPRLQADVQVPQGNFNNVVFAGAVARVVVTGDRLAVSSLNAGAAGGVVRLSGTVEGSRLDLSLVAIGVDLQRLLRAFNMTGYSGITNFRGTVTGTTADPRLAGNAEIFEGQLGQYQFDYARGRVVASRSEITLEDAVVRVLPAEVTLRGRISRLGTRTPTIELDIDVAEAPVDRILSLLEAKADVTGTLAGHLTIRGTGQNITATGNLALTDGSAAGYPITAASANVTYANGELKLANLVAQGGGATFTAEGNIDRRGNLAFTFVANDIALARLVELTSPYVALSGSLDMSGRVTGTTDDPNLVATVVSERPTINTVQTERFAADIVWDGVKVTASDVQLRTATGEFIIRRAVYNTDEKALIVEGGSLREFPFTALYTLVSESPYVDTPDAEGVRDLLTRVRRPNTGILNATFSAGGPLDQLEATFNLSAKDIDIAEVKDAAVELSVHSRRGLVELERFNAVAGPLNIQAQGTLISEGRTNIEVEAYNVDLDALMPATGPSYISGVATVSATVQGPISAPVITASADMENPIIYGVKFDALRTGQITVGRNEIDISSVQVTRGPHTGTFSGTLPWDWSELNVPADQPLALHAAMEEQTLGILAVFSDQIVADRTSGNLSANLDITGTLSNPNLAGRMSISEGMIGLTTLENNFIGVQADLVFSQDTVRVERLSGASSVGGSFEVVPGGAISLRNLISPAPGEPRGRIDVVVRANDLALIERNLLGYREWVRAKVATGESGIAISGPLMQPAIAGQITVADATAIFSPSAALPGGARARYAFNPTFDLAFQLQRDVWLRTPNLKALLEGQGRLTGTLNSPDLEAGLTIARGDIRLPTTRMNIARGTVNVDWTPESSRVVVDLRAQTTVSATGPTGDRRRYTIVMTVRGPLDSLQPENIDLRSDPPGLSRERMLAALGHFEDIYGGGEIAFGEQLSDIFTLAVPIVFEPLETAFIEALGLEEFNIEYGFAQPLAVFLSRRLFDDFYLSYWRIVTGAPSITGASYSLRLGYRLRDWLELSYITDSRRVNILEAAYSRRF